MASTKSWLAKSPEMMNFTTVSSVFPHSTITGIAIPPYNNISNGLLAVSV
jgi:hypothetical protein